jgi:nucleoside-diphosphate-sugar epimerase
VYAQDDGSWVDEGSPAEPAEGTGRRILEGERLVASAPFTGVTLRLAGIYGPGRTRLLEQVRSGEARIPRDEPRYTNRIHRDDCAGAIVHLLALATPDALYLGVDREPAPIADVQRWLAAELGVPAPPAEADPENVQDSPSARRNRSNKRCKNDRLIASGYVFRYPTFREGYRAILRS